MRRAMAQGPMGAPPRAADRAQVIATPALVLEVLRAGVIAVDEQGVVVSCNPQGSELLRKPVDAIVGTPIAHLLAPLAELRAHTGQGERGEVTIRHADGAEAVLGYTLSALEAGGAVVLLFQEISGVLALRRERDRLLQLAAVGEVLPSVLHELRNPLAAITSMLEVLVEEVDGEIQRDLHSVLSEVRRVSLGLQGIGGLGRSVRGHGCEAIDEAISEAVRVLQPTAERKNVELVDGVTTLPLLHLDRAVVKGIVFNLVRNAIDACGPGDRIRAEAALVDDSFELRVIDSGRGMSADVIARCTEIFFTTKDGGSGIGLAICRQAAERCGGTLHIHSEIGRGTTVIVRVPLTEKGEPECLESTV